ncbi:hypothetical protein EDB80DRAFT_571490 [Ilyonectria destructans]|nr:hypothetical protein EDB80DRAFT_571490 [Ilyonectria destructans]
MRAFVKLLILTVCASAAASPSRVLGARQAVVTPAPCEPMVPPPCEAVVKKRFNKFANAFIVKKNLTEAFEYISSIYINHNPLADDGPNAALDVLGPIWPSLNITVLRTTFKGNMGWLNYNVSGLGEVVDRFRWEDGCIVEHWDQGEVYPTKTKNG